MDQFFGYIDARRTYTYAELAQIMDCGKERKGKTKIATVREAIKELECPVGRLGRQPLISGRLLQLAIERDAMTSEDESEDDE